MSRSEVLASVDSHRSLFGNAGPYSVCAFNRLGPDAAEPSPKLPESACLRGFAAMLDCDTGGVTEKDGVSGLANDIVQPIHLLPRGDDQVA